MTEVFRLPDGTYDVVVVDATAENEAIAIEITIISGEHKGDVVAIRATGLGVDELDLLGMPGTLTVENGVPRFAVET
jgi:exosome complex RNA-binding protein Rrp42 (RNase PH superfamily)